MSAIGLLDQHHPAMISIKALSRGLVWAAFPLLLALGTTGCENRAIGRTCSTLIPTADKQDSQSILNDEALECPTRLCLEPAKAPGSSSIAMTAAFCTAECNNNSDCDDGETRQVGLASDKRCTGGFVCQAVLQTGNYKCKKLCVCDDFLGPDQTSPAGCPM